MAGDSFFQSREEEGFLYELDKLSVMGVQEGDKDEVAVNFGGN